MLCWHQKDNCSRPSALNPDKVPTAWAEEEPLRTSVATRLVGAFQNQGGTHTHVWARGQLTYVPQLLPSPCYLLQKIPVVLANADFIMFEVRIESKMLGLDIKNAVIGIAWKRVHLLISGTLLSLLEKGNKISEPGKSDVVVVCLFRSMYTALKKGSRAAHMYLQGRIPISCVKHILLIIHLQQIQSTIPYPPKCSC